MTAIGTKKSPVHPLAVAAFLTAVIAIALAFYGSMAAEAKIPNSPLNLARNGKVQETAAEEARDRGLEFAAFILPFLLGTGAAAAGGMAMRRIEQADGRYRGDAVAVFAIFIGGFAAVVGGCMIVAVFVWRFLPSIYVV